MGLLGRSLVTRLQRSYGAHTPSVGFLKPRPSIKFADHHRRRNGRCPEFGRRAETSTAESLFDAFLVFESHNGFGVALSRNRTLLAGYCVEVDCVDAMHPYVQSGICTLTRVYCPFPRGREGENNDREADKSEKTPPQTDQGFGSGAQKRTHACKR
uniref:Uncharacterized protein n=1 Tax=Steinernema glaseri TaxID=37863 RepID=A0A1I7ZLX3_9BILA